MKKILALLSLSALAFASCTETEGDPNPDSGEFPFIQEEAHLGIEPDDRAVPLNFSEQIGLWMPYVRFVDYMQGKSEEEFQTAVSELLSDASAQSVNTVYFHVHATGDAYYESDIYPKGEFLDGDYDPLRIVLDTAHSMGISVHAWLNPLRMQTVSKMDELSDDFIVKKWVSEDDPAVKIVGDRWYLDPAYDKITDLIADTAAEILDKYDVDGIHIDDYFYPTTDTSFDSEAFKESGSDDLAQWRRDNVSRFVTALYDTVKSRDKRLKFGISPQGNVNTDYNSQYADVALWAGTPGYADYIVPQLYYGFKNSACPFEQTLREWETLVGDSGVSLIIGLAEYKVGKADKWAGAAGENEWIDDPDIISRQIELVKFSTADGYALYR